MNKYKEFQPIKEAVETLIQALKDDPQYYYSWQANIAMAFYDVFIEDGALCDRESHRERVHESCNKAAKNFLNLLCK